MFLIEEGGGSHRNKVMLFRWLWGVWHGPRRRLAVSY